MCRTSNQNTTTPSVSNIQNQRCLDLLNKRPNLVCQEIAELYTILERQLCQKGSASIRSIVPELDQRKDIFHDFFIKLVLEKCRDQDEKEDNDAEMGGR